MGVGDLVMKNAAMLFKWRWRFSNENSPLWKHMVVSCSRLNGDRTIADQIHLGGEGPWGSICNIWKVDKEAEREALNGI